MSELESLKARVAELEDDNARGALYVEHLKGRIAELQADLKAEADDEHKRWCEATEWKVQCEQAEARVAELQDQIVRLIEAGHLMAEFSSSSHRQLWLEAVKEAIK